MRAALAAVLALCTCGAALAQDAGRLPRETFDVIPPAERVLGEPGDFTIWQTACRVGPADQARRRIVDIAAQEWAAFGYQTVDRTVMEDRLLPGGVIPDALNPERDEPRASKRLIREGASEYRRQVAADIAGYWSATEDGPPIVAAQNRAFTGPGRENLGWVAPWSAAFISWVMCEAGLGEMDVFARHVAHRVYIDQAIRARDGAAPEAAYVAYDPGEAEIGPGDMLCNPGGGVGYRAIADRRARMGEFASTHCDIVVRVDVRARRIAVIGGNVENSVSLTVLPAVRPRGGQLRPAGPEDFPGGRTVFAHLKLRAPAIEPNALDNTPTVRALGEVR